MGEKDEGTVPGLAQHPINVLEVGRWRDDPRGNLDTDLLTFAEAQIQELQVPGVAIGILRGDVIALGALGVANISTAEPMSAETLCQIGSVTKPILGTAVLGLVEEGKLEIDRPVQTYLPDFCVANPDVSEMVTVGDLMSHGVGWAGGDLFDDYGWGDDALRRMVADMRRLPQLRPFRQMSSYNNSAFYPLGRILEVVCELPFEAAMTERVLSPFGMQPRRFFGHDVLLEPHAVGHATGPHGLQVARPWALPRACHPAGGVVTSTRELMAFAKFHLEDGELAKLPGPSLRRRMQLPSLEDDRYDLGGPRPGLTWWLESRAGQSWSHTVEVPMASRRSSVSSPIEVSRSGC